MKIVTIGSLACGLLALVATARAAGPQADGTGGLPPRQTVAPIMSCDSLAHHDFSRVPGAPTSIISTELQAADAAGAEYCKVKGYVAPQVQFELRLPTQTYTGRYLQGGCGGACGGINVTFSPQTDSQLALGGAFAVGFNNSGHVGSSPMDTVWAAGGQAIRDDFAFRGVHVSAVAAKSIIDAFYGQPPALSYFDGCSNGGREGLMEAERFPQDFAGIISGAPAVWITPGVVRILWETRVNTDSDGKDILTPEAVQTLHSAVVKACDALDGARDGQIDEPRACHFDPRQLVCQGKTRAGSCLTAQQAEVARKLYQGPTDAGGHALYLGGEPYGSELTWVGRGGFPGIGRTLAASQIQNMIFAGNPPADFDWRTWPLDAANLRLLFEHGGYYDASSGDMRKFHDAGGKILLWQGAADSPAGSNVLLDYYQRVRDKAGGLDAARAFARTFVLPGVYHCGGGYVPYETSLLTSLVSWVEQGSAPDKLVATAQLSDGTQRTRPVFAYPVRAQYRGSGSVNEMDNFRRTEPRTEPDDHYHWAGESAPQDHIATGDFHATYVFPPTGKPLSYRIFVPSTYDGSKASPLVVVLHGYLGNQDSAFDQAPPDQRGILQQEAERHGFLLVAPAGYDGSGDYGAHLPLPQLNNIRITHSPEQDDLAAADVMNVIQRVKEEYRIDPSRLYVMGNSMGMTGTLQLAQEHPQMWCGIGPSDGPSWANFPVERLRSLAGAFFVNGERDTIALTATNRQLAERLRAAGIETRFLEIPGGDHGTAWYSAVPQMFDFFARLPCSGGGAQRIATSSDSRGTRP